MQNSQKFGLVGKTTIFLAASVFLYLGCFSLNGADYDGSKIQWKLDVGLEKDRFEETIEKRRGEGMCVVDIEQYRSGRLTKQAASWVEAMPSDEWEPQRELTVVEYKEENENFLKEGFVSVDI